MMPQNLRMISLLVALGCVVNAASSKSTAYSCPAGFEKIEGIDHKCFFFHTDWEGRMIDAKFSEAVKTCKGKNSTIVEPASLDEGNIISSIAKKRPWVNDIWINFHDIDMKASLIGSRDEALHELVESKYMGSLTTLDKIPDEWWAPSNRKPANRPDNSHCAYWSMNRGVCTSTLVPKITQWYARLTVHLI